MTRVLLWSFGIGIVVQLVAILATRGLRSSGWIAGWGAGALLRLMTVVAYAFVAGPVLGLPVGPALISLAAFLFVTSFVEPILYLKKSA